MGGGAPHAMGGGAPHVMGGGAPHAMGGRAPRVMGGHFGGGVRMGGGAHIGAARMGGRPRFSRAHVGGSRIGARTTPSRSAARAVSHGRNVSEAHRHPNDTARGRAAVTEKRETTPSGSRSAYNRSEAVRNTLNSHAVAGALHDRAALRNPNARAHIAASAATAGWHEGHGGGNGWWRHRNGGYGWVGPLFWPFAYDDLYDYAMWGYGDDAGFWDYGYNDIYAGLFSPYGYDDLAGYLPQTADSSEVTTGRTSGAPAAAADQLAPMCGEDSRDIAGLPIDQIQQAIAPDDAQRAALDDLANASLKAAQDIKAACPKEAALTAPDRLAAMQRRIEAMIAAVGTVQSPLQKFYDSLSDEQKARLNALGQDQHKADSATATSGAPTPNCGTSQTSALTWPTAEIDAKLHPTEAQRASLTALQAASAKAADMLKASCQSDDAITPPARLAAVGKRLEVMLQAVKGVRAALDDFYAKLSDEQKAQFEAIGPARTAAADAPATTQAHDRPTRQAHVHRYHHRVNVAGLIRHFISMAR